MGFFKSIYYWFKDSDGWFKILMVIMLLVIGLTVYFKFSLIKDLTSITNKPIEELTTTITETIDDSKKQLEEQKQELINSGNTTLEEGRQELDENKKKLLNAKDKAVEDINTFIESLNKH